MHNRTDRSRIPVLPPLLLAAILALTGCGNKGPLTLPPRDSAAAQPGKTVPPPAAAPARTAPADNNSPPAPAPQ